MRAFIEWIKSLFAPRKPADVIPIRANPPIENHAPVDLPPEPKADEPRPTPWLDEAKKYNGKKESDSAFNKKMSSFWYLVGLRGYTSISGTSRAWCGLFVAASLFGAGYAYQKNGASARNWRTYGQEIVWRVNGIPRGAIVQIEHEQKCDNDNNHVAFANGDCVASDLLKSGASIDLYGGNQNNGAKTTTYDAREICAVRWPPKEPLPAKVTASVNCTSGKIGKESTR